MCVRALADGGGGGHTARLPIEATGLAYSKVPGQSQWPSYATELYTSILLTPVNQYTHQTLTYSPANTSNFHHLISRSKARVLQCEVCIKYTSSYCNHEQQHCALLTLVSRVSSCQTSCQSVQSIATKMKRISNHCLHFNRQYYLPTPRTLLRFQTRVSRTCLLVRVY